MSHPTVFPALRSADVTFLCSAFGAGETEAHRDPSGRIVYAELALEGRRGHARPACGGRWLGGEELRPPTGTVSIYVLVADPDAHHDRARGADSRGRAPAAGHRLRVA